MEKSNKLVQNKLVLGFKATDLASVKISDTDFLLLLKNGKKITLKDGAMLAMTQPEAPISFEDSEITIDRLLKLVGQVDLSGAFEIAQSKSNSGSQTDSTTNTTSKIDNTDSTPPHPLRSLTQVPRQSRNPSWTPQPACNV